MANQTIPRRLIQYLTIDVVLNERGVSTVFFHSDMSKGHHQGELEESSQNTTTFSTHIGLYRRRGLITEEKRSRSRHNVEGFFCRCTSGTLRILHWYVIFMLHIL